MAHSSPHLSRGLICPQPTSRCTLRPPLSPTNRQVSRFIKRPLLSQGYKNRQGHTPGVSSPWSAGSWPTVLTVFLASINLSFLHFGLNPENSFSTHVQRPQQKAVATNFPKEVDALVIAQQTKRISGSPQIFLFLSFLSPTNLKSFSWSSRHGAVVDESD